MVKLLKKTKFKILALIIILFIIFCGVNLSLINSYAPSSLNKESVLITSKTGKVITTNLDIRSGASTSYDIIGEYKKGDEVKIVGETKNSWYKVKYEDTYGYISKDNVAASLDGFLFVGDSYTAFMKDTINANTKNHHIVAKSGVVPSYWLDNFNQMPSNSKVKGLTILLGVNGIKAYKYDETLKDMKVLLNKLASKYPDKKIYVQKVHPLGKNFSRHIINDITRYNNEIEKFCQTKSNLVIIDSSKGLVTSDGYLKYPDWEGIHHIPSKYETYYNNIGKAILDTY